MMNRFHALLEEREFLLADGATGTNYFAMGLMAGDAPELWNVDHPERVRSLHRAFIDAGSDIVLTNTFGGNRYRLALHGAEDRVLELNALAAKHVRAEAAHLDRPVIVAGSMGPTGEIFAPLGELEPSDGEAAFREQAEGLAEGGVDVLWIETMSSHEEVEAAVAGARSTGLPVVCTLSFDTNGATMMGVTPSAFMKSIEQLDGEVCGCGTNCGVGAAEVAACIVEMAKTLVDGQALVAKANCGIPHWEDGEIRYTGTPQLMADYARLVRAGGANIIGGCCGTTPEHVAAMHHALYELPPLPEPTMADIQLALGEVSPGVLRQLDGASSPAPTRKRANKRRRA
jgi:methionine synthase I (cobalamin-dependent)